MTLSLLELSLRMRSYATNINSAFLSEGNERPSNPTSTASIAAFITALFRNAIPMELWELSDVLANISLFPVTNQGMSTPKRLLYFSIIDIINSYKPLALLSVVIKLNASFGLMWNIFLVKSIDYRLSTVGCSEHLEPLIRATELIMRYNGLIEASKFKNGLNSREHFFAVVASIYLQDGLIELNDLKLHTYNTDVSISH